MEPDHPSLSNCTCKKLSQERSCTENRCAQLFIKVTLFTMISKRKTVFSVLYYVLSIQWAISQCIPSCIIVQNHYCYQQVKKNDYKAGLRAKFILQLKIHTELSPPPPFFFPPYFFLAFLFKKNFVTRILLYTFKESKY